MTDRDIRYGADRNICNDASRMHDRNASVKSVERRAESAVAESYYGSGGGSGSVVTTTTTGTKP